MKFRATTRRARVALAGLVAGGLGAGWLTAGWLAAAGALAAASLLAPEARAQDPPQEVAPAQGAEADSLVRAEDPSQGVYADSIVFGQSAALTGDAMALGTNMNLGIRAAFEEANRDGGVHGRTLWLVARDDGYEPEAAARNTAELAEFGVFGLIGAVGTPTSTAAVPVAADYTVPYIGPFTGAEFLRTDESGLVVNVRASYYQETEEMVARLTGDLGHQRIAILYQDDSYGRAGLSGVRQALGRRNMSLVSEGTYMRNTTAVKRALLDIRKGRPQAVIIIGAYRPAAAFVRWARQIRLNAVIVNISFVGSNALLNELGSAGNGVVVTQVVPFPSDTSVPVVAGYHRALRAVAPAAAPGFVSLEGYLAGRLAVEILRRLEPEEPPTREMFLNELREAGPIDLDGFVVEYGAADNQGSDEVFLTVIRGGRFQSVERLSR